MDMMCAYRRLALVTAAATLIGVAAVTGVGAAQDTFSIVAVDPVTGEVGSAGASCIAGAIIISDVHPGLGAIHTQSYWMAQNQLYARSLMDQGHAPQAIIDSLVAHDAGGNPTIRQYGIVDLIGGGRSAAYTGVNCFDYKSHLLGPTYAIQGNILLGQQILDAMESAYLGTPGPLAFRLMAALQGANVPGADTRCLAAGKPAISAFVRVARPGDPHGGYHLDLNVNNTSTSQNPIDLLQVLFDEWSGTVAVDASQLPDAGRLVLHAARPNPFNPSTTITYELPRALHVALTLFDPAGREVAVLVDRRQEAGLHRVEWRADAGLAGGVYFYELRAGAQHLSRRLVLVK